MPPPEIGLASFTSYLRRGCLISDIDRISEAIVDFHGGR